VTGKHITTADIVTKYQTTLRKTTAHPSAFWHPGGDKNLAVVVVVCGCLGLLATAKF